METKSKLRIRIGSVGWLIERYIREMNGLDTGTPIKTLGGSQVYTLRTVQRSPHIGPVMWRDLTKNNIKDHVRMRIDEGVVPATVSHDVNYLSGVLAYAGSEWDDCDGCTNAAVLAAKPSLTKHGLLGKSTPRDRRPEPEEIARLLSHFGRPERKKFKNCIDMVKMTLWQLRSARRISESCRVEWLHWNPFDRTLLVTKMKDPRSRNKNKVVALPERAEA